MDAAQETFANFLRKTTRRQGSYSSRPAANIKPTSNDFSITGTGFEGWLKVPKEKGVRQGWSKRFVVVRDFKVYIVDKDARPHTEQLVGRLRAGVMPSAAAMRHCHGRLCAWAGDRVAVS